MNFKNTYAAFMLSALVVVPTFANDQNVADAKKDQKQPIDLFYKGFKGQTEANYVQGTKDHIAQNGFSIQQLETLVAQLRKAKTAYDATERVTNYPGYNYKVMTPEQKKDLNLGDSITDHKISLLLEKGLPLYEAKLKEMKANRPYYKKATDLSWIKNGFWKNRTIYGKAGIVTTLAVVSGVAGYKLKQAIHPATRGEKNTKILDDLVERADRAEAGDVSALDQEILEKMVMELSLVSEDSLVKMVTLTTQGQYAELINFVEGVVRNEVAQHPAAEKRDGLFSKKDEDVFAQA